MEAECCTICLDSDPPPIQSGCACRSDTGLAHLECLIEKAVSQQAHRGAKAWSQCQTCGQDFTGAMRTGLGEAWWSRVRAQAEESAERLGAAHNLGACRLWDGDYAEAERIEREVLGVRRRVQGEEHPDTLKSAGNLAASLSGQGKHAEAERIHRQVLGVQRRVLGEEHPNTLASANNLAASLLGQGKHTEGSGSTGRCLVRARGCSVRSIPRRWPVRATWRRRSRTKGSTLTQSGSSGRCLAC